MTVVVMRCCRALLRSTALVLSPRTPAHPPAQGLAVLLLTHPAAVTVRCAATRPQLAHAEGGSSLP
jgi:hypothetical protein